MLEMLLIFIILFMFYVMYRLSTINRQLNLITKHLGIKETEIVKVSDEEIEKELEEELNHQKGDHHNEEKTE